nr:cell wall hydrolase [Evansella caseinilytica]
MFIYVTLLSMPHTTVAFSDQVIQRGATGDDVIELQARLQYIGFYRGEIDGVFGWGTYWAVRNYQSEFGMEVTGLAGEKTKAVLEKSTQYDKEWVHRMIREGRKFTYYGGTPLEIQQGPKGSRDTSQGQAAKQGKSPEAGGEQAQKQPQGGETQRQPEQPPEQQQQPEQQQPEQPPEQQQQPQQSPEQQQPEQAPPPAEQQASPEQPEPEPEEEIPVPEEEEPEATDDTGVQGALNVPEGFTENDIRIMAQAVYGEARGEPYVGQVAIAAVILNRLQSPTFPNTVSGVIFEPRAFTAVADGQIWMEPNETARKAVLDAINGQDPSGNALYYFNPDTATSGWIWTRPQIKRIGKHIFCK